MLPFVRPTIEQEDIDAVAEVLKSGWITTGPKAQAFEQALSEYLGGGAVVRAFNSGTSALEAALIACDIGPGDEVIVPAMSFVATANVVVRVGARPVFVDVDLRSRNLTADRVAAAITDRTRAIMPVHFAGLAVDMAGIEQLAREHGVRVIEDAAHAIGTYYQDRPIGAAGDLVCFSFHPNKNMTTIEGGAVACFDNPMAQRLERIRFHGIERDADGHQDVSEWGGKMNLTDVNSALGLAQLKRLDAFVARRRALVAAYSAQIPKHAALLPPADGPGHSWHIYAPLIAFDDLAVTRTEFQQRLQAHDIGSGYHYPAMHLFKLYRRFGYAEGDFPNAERIGAQTLTLPLFPAMADSDVTRVCTALAQVIEELEHGGA